MDHQGPRTIVIDSFNNACLIDATRMFVHVMGTRHRPMANEACQLWSIQWCSLKRRRHVQGRWTAGWVTYPASRSGLTLLQYWPGLTMTTHWSRPVEDSHDDNDSLHAPGKPMTPPQYHLAHPVHCGHHINRRVLTGCCRWMLGTTRDHDGREKTPDIPHLVRDPVILVDVAYTLCG